MQFSLSEFPGSFLPVIDIFLNEFSDFSLQRSNLFGLNINGPDSIEQIWGIFGPREIDDKWIQALARKKAPLGVVTWE